MASSSASSWPLRIGGLVLVGVVAVHGILLARTGEVEPCSAAYERMRADKREGGLLGQLEDGASALGEGLLGRDRMVERVREEHGLLGCYQVALVGE